MHMRRHARTRLLPRMFTIRWPLHSRTCSVTEVPPSTVMDGRSSSMIWCRRSRPANKTGTVRTEWVFLVSFTPSSSVYARQTSMYSDTVGWPVAKS